MSHSVSTPGDLAVDTKLILVVNAGSSSLKCAVYRQTDDLELVLSVRYSGLSAGKAEVRILDALSGDEEKTAEEFSSHDDALTHMLQVLRGRTMLEKIVVVGHRVVHGGPGNRSAKRVDDALMDELTQWVPLDPPHLPVALATMKTLAHSMESVPAVACFDTAFHRDLPERARVLPLPRWVRDLGVQKYGFHGLSYQSILMKLRRIDRAKSDGKIIVAHLGSGASLAAIEVGKSIETTMGLTPTGGICMSGRSGDLDPGVLIYLMDQQGQSADDLRRMLNKESGLQGLSGQSPDIRELLDKPGDHDAQLAVEIFCYQVVKAIGALTAALNGLETLIFTAGIGENSAEVRERVCASLGYLGLSIDHEKNLLNDEVISTSESRVTVRVMATDEERMIALECMNLMKVKS